MSSIITTLPVIKPTATTGNTELHSYDTRLGEYTPLKTENEVIELELERLTNYFTLSPKAVEILKILIRDMGTPANEDNINGVNVDNMLRDIYILGKTYYELTSEISPQSSVLSEQLEEMSSGMCPQGRCIRLYQVILTFG